MIELNEKVWFVPSLLILQAAASLAIAFEYWFAPGLFAVAIISASIYAIGEAVSYIRRRS